jgi:DNA-binding IclR family transcriptional regulator
VKLAAASGQRLPACATASGKAILAFMPEEMVQQILDRGMPRFTSRTHISPKTFFEDLHSAKEQGFAISEQEFEEAINAVAAPIFDIENQPIASIAVAGPAFRLTHERMIEIGPFIRESVREISQELTMVSNPRVNPLVNALTSQVNDK